MKASYLLHIIFPLLLAGCSERGTPPTAAATAPASPTAQGTGSPGPTPSPMPTELPAARVPATRFDPRAFRLTLERVAGGFVEPTFVIHAGDGSGRRFVLERAGTVRVIAGGALLPEPFLDLRSLVRSTGLEQGLLGLAFHPRFRENGRFFVAYTAHNNDNTIAEYRADPDRRRGDPSSARILLAIPDFAPNHNGGMLAFGPDGYLYVGTGDGGGAGDPRRNGQNLGALLGKLLRLDVDRGQPYAIPPGNPFAGLEGARPEIWAYGLRNPWRFSFDRLTGDLWIADVGQNAWEEINQQSASSRGGENYGWSVMEGAHCFRPATSCDATGLVLPVAEYGREGGCSITGGYVYRGSRFPPLAGAYYYGDFCSGRIWALYQDGGGAWRQAELLKTDLQISSFGEDEAGEVYVVGFDEGTIYRLGAG